MITLAAGGGDLIFLIAMLVFGAINWLANKSKEGQQPNKPASPARPPRAPQQPAGGDAEAERMRRFLEALGVPTDAPPPSAPVAPPPRPAPVRRPRVEKKKAQSAPPPLPERSLDEAEGPVAPVADIRVPELQTPELPVFQTVSSRVMADPDGEFATVSSTVSAAATAVPKAVAAKEPRGIALDSVRAALRSPESVRTALVLREVLGPPVALRG